MPLRTVHCGPCWAEFGGSPDAADIDAAPPEALGSRDPRDQREWPLLLASEQWVQLLRRDTRARLLCLARELTLRADWDTWETWPGWDRLMEVSGWARSTLAGWLRQLRMLGWLTVMESGSTPQFRPMSLAHVEGNRRAVYALRVPRRPGEHSAEPRPERHRPVRLETAVPVDALEARVRDAWLWLGTGLRRTASDQRERRAGDETWTPTWSFDLFSSVGEWVSSRARDFFHSPSTKPADSSKTEALRARFDEEWRAFADRSPTSSAQMLAAASELRRQHPVLARLSPKAGRALCRPYWRAGWSNDDVLHALKYRPASWSTLPAMEAARVVAPYRWAQSRLSAWRTDTGRVLPGHRHVQADRDALRQTIVTRHGRAALAAVPAGADRLRPADVRRLGQRRHAEAAETLRRRRAAELADARSAVRPAEDAASPEHAARISAEIRAAHEQRQAALREHLLAQARAAAERATAAPESGAAPLGPAETPQDRYERAKARALSEGRSPRPRRRRR